MLKPLGNDAEGERLHADHSFVAVRAVAHDPGQGGHFGKPTAVVLALQFDCERHAANVPPGPTVQQAATAVDRPDAQGGRRDGLKAV